MISNLAHIHPNAQIGANVTIDPFVVIHDDVVIGDGTHVMSNVTIFPASRIGKNCNIFPGAVIGAVPQDRRARPAPRPGVFVPGLNAPARDARREAA